MKKFFKWFLMLNKRLYKKASFVFLLILIPVCIFTFNFVSQQDSGIIHIVLCQTDKTDSVSSQVVEDLLHEDSIILFTEVDNRNEAIEMVRSSEADQAWIFSDDLQNKIDTFISNDFQSDTAVTVVCREQTPFSRIASEKLSGTMYKYYANSYYINFVRQNLKELDSLTDEELTQYFDNVTFDKDLFVFATASDPQAAISNPDTNYLMAPMRGILSILVVLCGLAATLFCIQDEKSGTFSFANERNRIYIDLFCISIAVANVSFFVMLSLFITNTSGFVIYEIAGFLLYTLCVSLFCLLLKQIFSSIRVYGSIIPLLCVIMIALCPVFFDFSNVRFIQLLFPPTYYINSLYNSNYLIYMVIYICITSAICALIHTFKKRNT